MVVVVKAMHTVNMHNMLLESLLRDVLMCLNGWERLGTVGNYDGHTSY